MSTATTTSHDTGQHTTSRSTTQPTTNPATQTTPNAAQRLRTTMAAVRLSFTWLGVRKTLTPEQRTTAARAFYCDRFWTENRVIPTIPRGSVLLRLIPHSGGKDASTPT